MLFKGAEPCLSACPKSQAKASPTPSCLGPTAWHLGLQGPRDNGVGWSPARPSTVAVEHLEVHAFLPSQTPGGQPLQNCDDPAGQVPDADMQGGPGERPSCCPLDLLLRVWAGRHRRAYPPLPAGSDLPQGGHMEVPPEAWGVVGSGDFRGHRAAGEPRLLPSVVLPAYASMPGYQEGSHLPLHQQGWGN